VSRWCCRIRRRQADSGRTTVHVPLSEHDALFVVFRRPARAVPRPIPAVTRTPLATLDGAWRVRFAGLGAPASLVLPTPMSWSASADPGVKYFSGTATYVRTIHAPASWLARGRRVVLALGDVRDLAEVVVNGVTLPLAWKAPFEVDVTRALHAGANRLEIRVTNEWTNRIIGDRAAPPEKKILSSAPAFFGGTPPLPPSGLLGPVRFVAVDLK
jgi:Glycosyl hydrolases family 2, sugar binding domain